MKGRITTLMVTMVAIGLLIGCAPNVPSVKHAAKKAVTKATVEVLEVKMEKKGDFDKEMGVGYIKISGKAVYHPAEVGAKPFKDLSYTVRFELLDDAGRVLEKADGIPDCGEYGKAENVVPNEPFPFVMEVPIYKEDIWGKIKSAKFHSWTIVQ